MSFHGLALHYRLDPRCTLVADLCSSQTVHDGSAILSVFRFCNQTYFVYLEPAVPADTEEDTDQQDEQEIHKVEEHAVVLALRDTYMPGLDGSDAVMFATLLADLFPNVQVPMIFDTFGAEGSKMRMNEQVSNLEEIPVLPKPPGDCGRDNLEGKKTH